MKYSITIVVEALEMTSRWQQGDFWIVFALDGAILNFIFNLKKHG